MTATVAAAFVLIAPSAAFGDPEAGGYAAPERPEVEDVLCGADQAWACKVGERVQITGEHLDDVRRVVFAGGEGSHDNRTARVVEADSDALEVAVPSGARTGRIVLRGADGRLVTTRRRVQILRGRAARPAPASMPAGSFTFPISGKYTIGREPRQGFGGGRNHKGHDVFAACGTPLVAVTDAQVQHVATQDAAGNYVVLQDASGRSYAYMHMAEPSSLREGDVVAAGQPVGVVGDTGRASGCHLHIELWTAPGWYEGGEAVDPLPELERWSAASGS